MYNIFCLFMVFTEKIIPIGKRILLIKGLGG